MRVYTVIKIWINVVECNIKMKNIFCKGIYGLEISKHALKGVFRIVV